MIIHGGFDCIAFLFWQLKARCIIVIQRRKIKGRPGHIAIKKLRRIHIIYELQAWNLIIDDRTIVNAAYAVQFQAFHEIAFMGIHREKFQFLLGLMGTRILMGIHREKFQFLVGLMGTRILIDYGEKIFNLNFVGDWWYYTLVLMISWNSINRPINIICKNIRLNFIIACRSSLELCGFSYCITKIEIGGRPIEAVLLPHITNIQPLWC